MCVTVNVFEMCTTVSVFEMCITVNVFEMCITVNVFEMCITLPGRSEWSLAATRPCRLQLCAVFGSTAGKLNWSLLYVQRTRV
jgi:hypothetical protein